MAQEQPAGITAVNDKQQRPVQAVTVRAVIIGLVLIPPNLLAMALAEVGWMSSQPTSLSIFANVVTTIFLICLANLLLQKLLPRFALRRGEMLTVFIMLSVAQGISGYDRLQQLMGLMVHPFYYATPDNRYEQLFFSYLPQGLMVSNRAAVKAFHEGGTTLWGSGHLHLWVRPYFFWLMCTLGVGWVSLCLVSLLRRRWIEHERLSFPLAQVPLAMTERHLAIYGNGLFWLGFAVAAAWSTLRVLHYFLPAAPLVQTRVYLDFWQSPQPWRSVGQILFSFNAFPVSISWFMPLDLSFSAWFFYFLAVAQILGRGGLGFGRPQGGRLTQQAVASWLTVAAVSLWRARTTLTQAWQNMLSGIHTSAEREEALDYQLSILGLLAGVVGLTWFLNAMGIGLSVAIFFWVMFFLLVLAATRIRAELGAPATELDWVDPGWMLTTVLGTEALGPRNLTGITMLGWLHNNYRCDPAQHMMEGFKLVGESGSPARGLAGPVMLALALGFTSGFWGTLGIFYSFGAGTASYGYAGSMRYPGYGHFKKLVGALQAPRTTNWGDLGHVVAGLAITLILYALRQRYIGFPLHPVGFALGWAWIVSVLWFPIFVGWLLKAAILHYGGLRAYQTLTPAFVGLFVGDFVMGFFSIVLGEITKIRVGGVPF